VSSDRAIRFGRFRFHPLQGLCRGKREIRVTAKSLAVLRVLAERPGEVVTKEALFGAVWPDTAVSDAALTSCIQELRQALGDDARHPQYIETLHRRGFRFIARPAPGADDAPAGPLPAAAFPEPPIVGREPALGELSAALARALGGTRQVVFVTGEPGIGKTALVQSFAAGLADRDLPRVTWGECVERYGAGEPYQPLLDALARLLRPSGEHLVATLRRYAPTWLVQLPALQTPAELRSLQRRTAGVTPERMLRELTDALEAITVETPLVLCLEDLHWSDLSTLDWVAAFARRPDPARLLLVSTHRPQEGEVSRSVQAIMDDLLVKGLCREIALGRLDEAAVQAYVAGRFPASADDRGGLRELGSLVHRHTEGNPLFVVNMLDDLLARGVLAADDGRWAVELPVEAGVLGIPKGIRWTIERQIDRLEEDARGLLEVASVLGGPFAAASVAAGAGLGLEEVEAVLRGLARRSRLVREGPAAEWPDGTVSATFEFLHALYREVLRDRLPPARRAELHRRIGSRLEEAHGARAPEIAAELAEHFDQARDAPRAILYLQHAAQNDQSRSAHPEAQMHFRRALALLEGLPASAQRDEREVALQSGLGGVLMATRGYGAPEVEAAYTRARSLCRRLGNTPQFFPVLWGLWLFSIGRGALKGARELADELSRLADHAGDPVFRLQAHHAEWATAFSAGDLAGAEAHARDGTSLYDPERHGGLASTYGGHDPGVCALNFSARVAALAGRTDTAHRTSERATALARELGHPFSLAQSWVFGAAMHETRRDVAAAREAATAAATLSREHSFPLLLAWASVYEGWALVEQGDRDGGLPLLVRGVAGARSTGSSLWQPVLLGILAEAQLACGQVEAGRASLEEALALSERIGEGLAPAELHRVSGALLLAGAGDASGAAEGELRRAVEIARDQGARLLELRAAVSLARLWSRQGRHSEARALVARARAAVPEGAGLPDMREADELLVS
jgi:DNA-binding winged helix-turn-helix (wHTH) protein/predicted ATPase